MINATSTLEEVAFEICTALDAKGLAAVLVGGSAATYYAPEAYQSFDIDFICYFDVDRARERRILDVLCDLGYAVAGGRIEHASNPFMVDFPKGPLLIADDEIVARYDTVRRADRLLFVITPYDCVRDRLAKYFYWNDFSALDAAVGVTAAHAERVDLVLLHAWAEITHAASRLEGYDVARKFDEFLAALRAKR